MSKLISKARAGVTLVELLVVILIVTILSISLLPLLKPYIEEAKYAAEPIPVLANIQTKINLYQYEKDKLPCTVENVNQTTGAKTEAKQDNTYYSWMIDSARSDVRAYKTAWKQTDAGSFTEYTGTTHLENFVDINWQDLMGRRMNPSHFVYHLIKGSGTSMYGYVVGVFGDGDGLGKGTGYAVMNLVDVSNKLKLVATWKRYKPWSDDQVSFSTENSAATKESKFCYVPTWATVFPDADDASGERNLTSLIGKLKAAGWEFNFDDALTQTAAEDE